MEREADLLTYAQSALKLSGLLWWRNPVQGVLYNLNGKTFMKPSPIKGFPDLSFVSKTGRLYCAELKSARGKPSKEQIEWIEKLNLTGCIARIVKTREEMDKFIDVAQGDVV